MRYSTRILKEIHKGRWTACSPIGCWCNTGPGCKIFCKRWLLPPFRLEKLSVTIKSNHSSRTAKATANQVPHPHGFQIPLGMGSPPLPWQPVARLDRPFREEIFFKTQPKPPLVLLEAVSSCPVICSLGAEPNLTRLHPFVREL